MDGKSAFDVVDQTEVLAGLLDRDDIHKASRVCDVCSHFSVHFDKTLHQDHHGLTVVERILQSVSEEDDQRQAIACLVRTGGGFGCVGAVKLAQHPMMRRAETLLVFLWSSTHLDGFSEELLSRL